MPGSGNTPHSGVLNVPESGNYRLQHLNMLFNTPTCFLTPQFSRNTLSKRVLQSTLSVVMTLTINTTPFGVLLYSCGAAVTPPPVTMQNVGCYLTPNF